MSVPNLQVKREVDGAAQHEQHEHAFKKERMVIVDALAGGCKTARHETGKRNPECMQKRTQRLHAQKNTKNRDDCRANKHKHQGHFRNKPRGLHNVWHHMLRARLGRIQTCAAALAENAQRKRHHNQAQTAHKMHKEAEHVIGVRQVVQIADDRRTRGGQARYGIEKRIGIRSKMPRIIQGNGGDERQHNPDQARYRQRLLARQTARVQIEHTQRAANNQAQAAGKQIA